jgi:hypothetical protein
MIEILFLVFDLFSILGEVDRTQASLLLSYLTACDNDHSSAEERDDSGVVLALLLKEPCRFRFYLINLVAEVQVLLNLHQVHLYLIRVHLHRSLLCHSKIDHTTL